MTAPGLLELVGLQDWPTFVLVSARLSGLFLAAPLWSMTGVPKTVRSAAVVLLSVVLLPVMLAYNAWQYLVFRGKVTEGHQPDKAQN